MTLNSCTLSSMLFNVTSAHTTLSGGTGSLLVEYVHTSVSATIVIAIVADCAATTAYPSVLPLSVLYQARCRH